jgi:hypothetical protein
MTTNIIARFADGKLLVEQKSLIAQQYYANGFDVRIGHIGHVDKVLSVTTDIERYGGATPLHMTSAILDTVRVRMFRADWGSLNDGTVGGSGSILLVSGMASLYNASGLISGLLWYEEVMSGTPVSGLVRLTVNAIGY